jgi:hypothetical protein
MGRRQISPYAAEIFDMLAKLANEDASPYRVTLIGGPLFVRDRKHVVLSDAGRAYMHKCDSHFSTENEPSNLHER